MFWAERLNNSLIPIAAKALNNNLQVKQNKQKNWDKL